MTQNNTARFARPHNHARTPADKWEALELLTECAADLGVNHRTLGVLRALMTFLPGRGVAAHPGGAIVFPSNRTLGRRLNGMPESTLRRHLAALVRAGIVNRHSSANGKRFARRTGTGETLAFGFDLAPIAARLDDWRALAEDVRARRDRIAARRAEVARLRQCLVARDGAVPLTRDARRILRNTPDEAALEAVESALNDALGTEEMGGSDVQNERHIDIENEYVSDSERAGERHAPDLALARVVATCHEYRSYDPTPVRRWHDLVTIADRLTPMMGIDAPVFHQAIKRMGLKNAVTAVLCILERLGQIANPGGYLRRLAQRAGQGRFDIAPMLAAVDRCRGLPADNREMSCTSMA